MSVDELKERLDRIVCASMVSISVADFHETLDSLLAAAHEEERERITAILDDIERRGVVPFLSSVRQRLSLPIYDWRTQASVLAPKEREP